MTTPETDRLLQTCAQLDPAYFEYLNDSQCTPEQLARVAAATQYIRSELDDIRRELLDFAERNGITIE